MPHEGWVCVNTPRVNDGKAISITGYPGKAFALPYIIEITLVISYTKWPAAAYIMRTVTT